MSSTPLPQDLFSRFAVGMFDETDIIGVPTGGLAFFGNPAASGSRTLYSPDHNTVDIDIIRGSETIAALVPRGRVTRTLGSLVKSVRTERHSGFSRKYPLAIEESAISSDQLLTRLPGEPTVNSGLTRMFRLQHHAARKHNENMRRIMRLCEVLAWQSLLTGKQDAVLGTANTDLQYDFRRNAALTIQCGTSWAGGSADILGDFDDTCDKLRSLGHINPDMAVLAGDAMQSFVKDATVQKVADNRRFTYITIGDGAVMAAKYQRFVDGGMTFQGNLRTPKGRQIALFTYNEVYNDDSGNAIDYVPAGKVLVAGSTARCDRYFGPPEALPMTPAQAQLYREWFGFDPNAPMMPPNVKGGVQQACPPQACFCRAYTNANWTEVSIETQCAPIFATTQTDAFAVMDVEP